MVSNTTLAALCVWSGLHEHLMFDSYILANSIQLYADRVKVRQVEEYAFAENENRLPGQYWLDIEPPKVFYLMSFKVVYLLLSNSRLFLTSLNQYWELFTYRMIFLLLVLKCSSKKS